jgi:hypothetical protein
MSVTTRMQNACCRSIDLRIGVKMRRTCREYAQTSLVGLYLNPAPCLCFEKSVRAFVGEESMCMCRCMYTSMGKYVCPITRLRRLLVLNMS